MNTLLIYLGTDNDRFFIEQSGIEVIREWVTDNRPVFEVEHTEQALRLVCGFQQDTVVSLTGDTAAIIDLNTCEPLQSGAWLDTGMLPTSNLGCYNIETGHYYAICNEYDVLR